jgi:NADH:ubiquinone oxidoreductase subunit H
MPKLPTLTAGLRMLLSLILLASCKPAAPELIDIFDLSPAQVETDDTVVLRGSGYPPGEAGVLELKGMVSRAGVDDEPLKLSVAVRSETEERVVWNMAPKLVETFTSTEEGQRHATFRGTATLAFAPARQGAPPIHGSAAVVLDVFPPKAAAEAVLADRELLEFYGAELSRAGQGVKVTSVVPEGRLARAGVQATDVIVSFGGLRAHTPSDLLPKAGQREARIEILREPFSAGQAPAVLGVNVEGYRPQLARRWQWGLALLGALGALLILAQSRWAQALGFFKTRLVAARNTTHELQRRSEAHKEERLPRGFSGFLAVSALFAAVKLDLLPRAKDLDLALLYFALATLDFVAAFLAAGVQRNRWSLWRALLGWVHCLPRQLALMLALLAVVLERGSLALPLDPRASSLKLQAFVSPCAFVAALTLLALALSQRFASRPDGSGTGRRVKLSAAERAVSALGGVSSLLLLATTQVLLFSGFGVPWLGQQGSRVLPVIVFQVQFTLVYVGSLLLERSLPGVGRKSVLGLDLRLLLPMAALSLVLAPIWLADVWAPWIRECVSLGLKLGVGLLFSGLLLALLRARGRTWVAQSVNPWL